MSYALHLLVLLSVYVILAYSLDLLAGHGGILSLAQAAFFGIGAYSSALLTTRVGLSPAASLLAGMALAAAVALLVCAPAVRLREDYFILSTFAFQMIAVDVGNNWQDMTGGPLGVVGIPPFGLGEHAFDAPETFAPVAACAAAGAMLIVWRTTSGPFGRVLHAIREDEVFVQSAGRNPLEFKAIAFAVSAALAAAAGSLYAHHMAFIDPSSFAVGESLLVLSMVIFGGAGTRLGPLVGAAVLLLLPEVLRFLGLPAAVAAHARQILYGSFLIAVLLFRPDGLCVDPKRG